MNKINTSVSGLQLEGILKSYSLYDVDHDGFLDTGESLIIPDFLLPHLLEDAVDERGFPNSNGHNFFFNALPLERLARLFANGEEGISKGIDIDYWEILKNEEPSKTALLIDCLVGYGAASPAAILGEGPVLSGEELADRFLLSGAVVLDQWGPLFGQLQTTQPDYVQSRTHIRYDLMPIELEAKVDAKKYDTNKDGAIGLDEAASYSFGFNKNYELFLAIMVELGMGSEESKHSYDKVATQFVLWGMDALSQGVLVGSAADSAIAWDDNDNPENKIHVKGLKAFVNRKFMVDRGGMVKAMQAVAEHNPMAHMKHFLSYVAVLNEANKDFLGKTNSKIIQAASDNVEEKLASTPYQIDGFRDVNEGNFEKVVLKSNKPVLVVFGRADCPFCAMGKETFKNLGEKFAGRVSMAVVDSPANENLVDKWNIKGIPTFLLFHNGAIIKRGRSLDAVDEMAAFMSETFPEPI